MEIGAITQYIDVAQVALYAFWVFFAGLLFYIRQEDRREGYPLESDQTGHFDKNQWVFMPTPKTFKLPHGHGEVSVPNDIRDTRAIKAERLSVASGSPLEPIGDPMLANVGPGSFAERADTPDLTMQGHPKIVPLRSAPDFSLASEDPDPRGMNVVYADKVKGGTVKDVWIDQSEYLIRYLEVEADGQTVLLPMTFALIKNRRDPYVYVHAILSGQAANVPKLANPEQVTLLEEDKICAYYGAGQLYATPQRAEPLI